MKKIEHWASLFKLQWKKKFETDILPIAKRKTQRIDAEAIRIPKYSTVSSSLQPNWSMHNGVPSLKKGKYVNLTSKAFYSTIKCTTKKKRTERLYGCWHSLFLNLNQLRPEKKGICKSAIRLEKDENFPLFEVINKLIFPLRFKNISFSTCYLLEISTIHWNN